MRAHSPIFMTTGSRSNGLPGFLQNVCKDVTQPLQIQQRRPPSHVLTFWSGHIRVCLSPDDLLTTNTFFCDDMLRDCRPDRSDVIWPTCRPAVLLNTFHPRASNRLRLSERLASGESEESEGFCQGLREDWF